MIGFWNRAELLITYDLKRFCQVRDVLQAAGLDYRYKTKSVSGSTLGTTSRLEYRLFVHRDNLEWEQTLLKEL